MRGVSLILLSYSVVAIVTASAAAAAPPASLPASYPASTMADASLECDSASYLGYPMSMMEDAPSVGPQSTNDQPVPGNKSTAELCSEAGDPRCQLKQGDTESAARWPQVHSRVADHFRENLLFASIALGRSFFDLNTPLDSGLRRSQFRPPRTSL